MVDGEELARSIAPRRSRFSLWALENCPAPSHRAARPTPGRDRWRLVSHEFHDRRPRRQGASLLGRSAADDRCEAQRPEAIGFACSPRTYTSARQGAAPGSRQPNLGPECAEKARGFPAEAERL